MTLSSIHRGSTPVALAVFLAFGCATVRAPASAIGSEVPVGENGAESQVELWLESGTPVSEEEKARAVAQVRSALDRATATLVSDDGETLLVVRAQGIARTGSRKANQQAAKVGIVVGAAALIAIVVVAAVASGGKGGGGSLPKLGGAGIKAAPVGAAPRLGGFRAAPPRFSFPVPSGRSHGHAPRVYVDTVVHVPVGTSAGEPLQEPSLEVGMEQGRAPEAGQVEPEERTAFPPREPITLHLPPPRPLDPSHRKFFDKDFTRLELLVVDRESGRPTWVKTVEGKVDPRDPAAVKRLLASAIQDQGGWEPAVP
jgi:hypothetical protein